MKKKNLQKFNAAILALMLLCVFTAGCGEKPLTLDEQLELGVRYLSEMDFQNAVIAFTAAIEIDPKSVQAYTGLLVTHVAQGNETEAQAAWTAMQATDIETEEVLAGILDTVDILMQAGADGEALQNQLTTFLTAQQDGADLLSALLENADAQATELIPTLPGELQEEQDEVYLGEILPGSEEYDQLENVLYRFRMVCGPTYDCRNIVTESAESDTLLNCILSPSAAFIDDLYPGENRTVLWNIEGDWAEFEWVPDPLGKLGKYGGYSYVNRERIEWILKNIFNCPQSAIEAMEAPILNGEDEWRYLYEDRFYYEIGGIGDPQRYPDIVSIQQIDQYYLVRYTIRDNYDDKIESYNTALFKLKKIDGSFYWSLYYSQEGFLLDEASWVYQDVARFADKAIIPLLQVQPTTFLPQAQRRTFTVTADPWLNLRAGPGTEYDRIGTVSYGMVITEIGRSDNVPEWIVIECENEYEEGFGYIDYGWISTEFIE